MFLEDEKDGNTSHTLMLIGPSGMNSWNYRPINFWLSLKGIAKNTGDTERLLKVKIVSRLLVPIPPILQ